MAYAECIIQDARVGMPKLMSHAVRLLVGASVYLGPGVPYVPDYRDLYDEVYCTQGERLLRRDGYLLTIQTNAYEDGRFVNRYLGLCGLMRHRGWRLLDEKVWQRRKADHFQVPFSHVHLWAPPNGTATRRGPCKNKEWFRGVWDYPQTKAGAHNAYPREMCGMLIDALTDKDDIVVDPFAGTGALLARAAEMGRNAVGFEIDPGMEPDLVHHGVKVLKG